MEDDDPEERLVAFLAGLPITIREHVHSLVLMAAGIYPHKHAPEDLMPLIQQAMKVRPASLKGYRCAMICGAVEVALAKPEIDHEDMLLGMMENNPSAALAKAAFKAPLFERHRDAASESFARLREGPLRPEYLKWWSADHKGSK